MSHVFRISNAAELFCSFWEIGRIVSLKAMEPTPPNTVTDVCNTFKKYNSKNKKFRQKILKLNAKLDRANQRCTEYKNMVNIFETENLELKSRIEKLSCEKHNLEEELEDQAAECHEYIETLLVKNMIIKDMSGQIKFLQEDLQIETNARESLEIDLKHLRDAYDEQRAELGEAHRTIDNLRCRLVEFENQAKIDADKLREKQLEVEQLQHEVKILQENIDIQKLRAEEQDKLISSLKENDALLPKALEEKRKLQHELMEKTAALEEKEKQLEAVEKAISEQGEQITKIQEKLDKMEQSRVQEHINCKEATASASNASRLTSEENEILMTTFEMPRYEIHLKQMYNDEVRPSAYPDLTIPVCNSTPAVPPKTAGKILHKRHVKDSTKSKAGNIFCKCGFFAGTLRLLENHIKNASRQKRHKCNKCCQRFVYKSQLNNHTKETHGSATTSATFNTTCSENFEYVLKNGIFPRIFCYKNFIACLFGFAGLVRDFMRWKKLISLTHTLVPSTLEKDLDHTITIHCKMDFRLSEWKLADYYHFAFAHSDELCFKNNFFPIKVVL